MVGRRAHAVDVGAAVQLDVAVDLLGAHVGRRADDLVGLGQDGPGRRAPDDLRGEAEVHDLHRPVAVHHQVLGLQVAVHGAERVPGIAQGRGDGLDHEQHVDFGDAHLALEQGPERVAAHEVHQVEVAAVRVLRAVPLHDAGMVHAGQRARLCLEPLQAAGLHQRVRVKHLHRDLALELEMPGAPDRGGAAAAADFAELEVGHLRRSLHPIPAHGWSTHLSLSRSSPARAPHPFSESPAAAGTPAFRAGAPRRASA